MWAIATDENMVRIFILKSTEARPTFSVEVSKTKSETSTGNTYTLSLTLYRFYRIVREDRVRNLKFATYLKFATCENTNKINELW